MIDPVVAGVRHQTATLIDFNGSQIAWDSLEFENELTLNRMQLNLALAMDSGNWSTKELTDWRLTS